MLHLVNKTYNFWRPLLGYQLSCSWISLCHPNRHFKQLLERWLIIRPNINGIKLPSISNLRARVNDGTHRSPLLVECIDVSRLQPACESNPLTPCPSHHVNGFRVWWSSSFIWVNASVFLSNGVQVGPCYRLAGQLMDALQPKLPQKRRNRGMPWYLGLDILWRHKMRSFK